MAHSSGIDCSQLLLPPKATDDDEDFRLCLTTPAWKSLNTAAESRIEATAWHICPALFAIPFLS